MKILPFCPHCGKGLSYLAAWGIHTKGEYECPHCGGDSKIKYRKVMKLLAVTVSLIGTIIAVPMAFFPESIRLESLFWIVLPFFLFFTLSPLLMVLSPQQARKKKPEQVPEKKPKKKPAAQSRPFWEETPFQEPLHEKKNRREPAPPGDDPFRMPPVNYDSYYSSKYNFSLFEEGTQKKPTQEKTFGPRQKRPERKRVDPPRRAGGSEEEIDQILQDFIDP